MRTIIAFLLIACLTMMWSAQTMAQGTSGYTPPDMFGEPDAQESVSEAAIPPLPVPAPPPAAPIIVKAAPPVPPPAPAPVTKPLSDALRGVDNKAPPPPLPNLNDNVATKPSVVPKPDMTPMGEQPLVAKEPMKPIEKPIEKPMTKPVIMAKPMPPTPVEPAIAVPVAPVEKEPAPLPIPAPVLAPAPVPLSVPLARAVPTTPPAQIMAPPPAPIIAPDVAPQQEDTSKNPNLAAQLIFAPGAADMVPNQKTVLAQDIIAALQQDPSSRLQIIAYATAVDEGMSSARRISLSRALAIRDHLKETGIVPERIDVRAMGSQTNASPVDRVDLLLIPAR